jgi:hypothetical protein
VVFPRFIPPLISLSQSSFVSLLFSPLCSFLCVFFALLCLFPCLVHFSFSRGAACGGGGTTTAAARTRTDIFTIVRLTTTSLSSLFFVFFFPHYTCVFWFFYFPIDLAGDLFYYHLFVVLFSYLHHERGESASVFYEAAGIRWK